VPAGKLKQYRALGVDPGLIKTRLSALEAWWHKLALRNSVRKRYLLAGADVGVVDNDKRNAIAWAASRGNFPAVISTLAVLGANYNARDFKD